MHPISFQSLFLIFALGLCVSLSACRSSPAYDTEIVRLDSAEAVEQARAVEQDVAPQPAEGFDIHLWASERLLADPIALDVDAQGRVYATGSGRSSGLLDVRGHSDWTTTVLTHKTVEDQRAFIRREMAPERSDENEWLPDFNEDGSHDWRDLTVQKERLYLVEDSAGRGWADRSQVMMEGFDSELTDAAGGLLVDGEDIYVGAFPAVWRVRDESGDGVIDFEEQFSHGYGVHFGFFGHGLSGIVRGPDGRVYWGVGDLGFTVVDDEGREHSYPDQGAILRANPDGSDFEVVALGLRNPHEFAFDKYGNVISVDNDGDHPGEHERLVYLVDGSDSGWRAHWQYGKYTDPKNNDYNVWMDEGLHRARFEDQAAYIVPPITPYHNGPTGVVYNPGTALSEEWQDHFLMSEFIGSPSTAKVHAFRLRQEGAGFELERDEELLRGVLATGIAFGPDGALYVADWVEGWESNGEGRIWKMDVPEAASSPQRTETRTLLAESFADRAETDLLALLQHADMRVRMKAQFELADRSEAATLLAAARQDDHQLARLHGLWGIGQLARDDIEHAGSLVEFLEDDDPEVRAQAAKGIGDVAYTAAGDALIPLLEDAVPRVRFFAAQALGQLAHGAAVDPLVAMLEANDDEDVYLRHAGALALARIGDAEAVAALADRSSRAVRIAAVVALRRMEHPDVARFLDDEDAYVVTEAARAINDDGAIEDALPDLARLLGEERAAGEALFRRVINANLRVGTGEAAQRVAAYATREGAPEAMRVEAIDVLGVWPQPSVLDRVDGVYHGAVERDTAIARAAVEPLVEPLLTGDSTPIRAAVAEAAGRLHLASAAPALLARVQDDPSADVRVAALEALQTAGPEHMENAARAALSDRSETVRTAALDLLPALDLPDATTAELLATVLDQGTVEEQQRALNLLGPNDRPSVHQTLDGLFDQLVAGTLAPELELDLLEAVEAGNSETLHDRLEAYRADRPDDDPVVVYRATLRGGDEARGREIFFEHAGAQCTRCHALRDIEGAAVGPNLGEIGAALTREQLLEALVDPSARLAPGFGSVSLTLQEDQRISGLLIDETASHLVVRSGDEEQRIAKPDIEERTHMPSAMPSVEDILDEREIRDLVAFLSALE